MADLPTFRIHFAEGEPIEIQAETPDDARCKAAARRPGTQILKTKRKKD